MMNDWLKKEAGFTTTELIIAIQVSFFVISLAYIGYLFSAKLFNRWHEKMQIETHLAQVSAVLSKSLDQLQSIDNAAGNDLRGVKVNGDSLHIRIDDRLWVNRQAVGDRALPLHFGQLEYVFPDPDDPGALITGSQPPENNLNAVSAIRFNLLFTKEKRRYPLEIHTRLPNLKRSILDRLKLR